MSYKCFTFKTICLLGNIMQAHIALATLRGCEFPSSIIHNKYPHAESAEDTDWHVALPVLPSGGQHERSE